MERGRVIPPNLDLASVSDDTILEEARRRGLNIHGQYVLTEREKRENAVATFGTPAFGAAPCPTHRDKLLERRLAFSGEGRVMKPARSLAGVIFAMILVAIGAAAFPMQTDAQDQSWLVVRADYGYRNQRNDVTDLVHELISRGGVNGRISVSNQTMGGDPARGADKTLRVFARNRRGEEREFDFKEGGSFDVAIFAVPPPSSDWDDRARNEDRGNHDRQYFDRDDANGVWIIRAYYGVQRQQADVTQILRGIVGHGALEINVNNRSMGGDPAPGLDKVLIVVYRYQGGEAATAVREGGTLSIP